MRVVVTGADGFIGWHLVHAIAGRGDAVQAWVRRSVSADWPHGVDAIAVDVTDAVAVAQHLARSAPDLVIHLAAQSSPGRSWEQPARTFDVNVLGAIHLLDAVRALKTPPKTLIAGSSAEYANREDGQPIAEDTPAVPGSPYGASKLAVSHMAGLYVRRFGLDLVTFRPFFVTGARKTGDVCSDFARRVVAIERGEEKTLRAGSLDVVRDILDVRDGVTAILRLAEAGRSGEVYNVSSGRGVRLADIVDGYRRFARVPFEVTVDPGLERPMEQRIRIGDCGKLRALGWTPAYALDDTLRSILDYWRKIPPAGQAAGCRSN